GVTLRELANHRVLIADSRRRVMYITDSTLTQVDVLLDSIPGTPRSYPLGTRLIPYLADSLLIVEGGTMSPSLLVVDPGGKIVRAAASPRTTDGYRLTNSGPLGVDARGRLLYEVVPYAGVRACEIGATAPPAVPRTDSAAIARADFETRTSD